MVQDGINIHIPLEEVKHVLLGTALYDMTGVIATADDMNIKLALYSEFFGERKRLFIGRDYLRMDTITKEDFRIELLEKLLNPDDYECEDELALEHGMTVGYERVVTSPLLRLWKINIAPPMREIFVRDFSDCDRGLQFLTIAYVLCHDKNVPQGIKLELQRM